MTDKFDHVSLKQLKYFVAIAEERSIRQASERLNISQPPLSRQIKDLELTIGHSLFNRSVRGVTLTPVGVEFYGRAKDIVSRLNEAVHESQQVGAGMRGALTVGFSDDFLYGRFAETLGLFIEKYPRVRVCALQEYSGRLANQVNQGAIDLAFVATPLPAEFTETAFYVLDRAPLYALVPKGHAIASNKTVSLSQLSGEDFLMASLPPSSGYYQTIMDLFRSAGITPRINSEIYPTAMIANLVAQGRGVSLVTIESITPMHMGVQCIRLRDKGAVIERSAIWRRGMSKRVARQFFFELTGKKLVDEVNGDT